MKPELLTAWIAALRSGKYEQGRDRLCHDGRYCCLGVLYEISGGRWKRAANGQPGKRTQAGSAKQIYDYADEFGLPETVMTRLARMNDGDDGFQSSFEAIADWLEHNSRLSSGDTRE